MNHLSKTDLRNAMNQVNDNKITLRNDHQEFSFEMRRNYVDQHNYLAVNLKSLTDGVVALAMMDGAFVMIKHTRLNTVSTEFVRGFLKHDEDPVSGAIREFKEELSTPNDSVVTGELLPGAINSDNAFTDQHIYIVALTVSNIKLSKLVMQATEGVNNVMLINPDDTDKLLNITDGFTLAAIQKYKLFKQA